MKHLYIVFIFAILTGCSPKIRVFSDYDPDYNLWAYKTFDWGQKVKIEEGKNPLHYNELNDKRIKAAVEEQMTLLGYQLNSENPDLIVHYHIIIENKSTVVTEPYGYTYGPYWTRMNTNTDVYREGTLIIDLMDKKTQHLIWRGWAAVEIEGINPKKIDALIKTAVFKIFQKYPKTAVKSQSTKDVALK
jgi:hypothetical protein